MEAIISYTDGVRFEAECRGHRIITDQPPDKNGTDKGMTPPELLLASLGTCAAHYAILYLDTRGLPTENLKVRVVAEGALQPMRLSSFRIEVAVPELEPRHQEGVLRAVKNCMVHNTLLQAPAIETVLTSAAHS